MKYLLDTHVLVWLHVGDRRLTREQLRVLRESERSREPLAIADLTLWELARMTESRKVTRREEVRELLEDIELNEAIAVLPIDAAIALDAMRLPAGFPEDPVDRLITSTARVHGLKLVTADQRIRESGAVEVV